MPREIQVSSVDLWFIYDALKELTVRKYWQNLYCKLDHWVQRGFSENRVPTVNVHAIIDGSVLLRVLKNDAGVKMNLFTYKTSGTGIMMREYKPVRKGSKKHQHIKAIICMKPRVREPSFSLGSAW